MVVRFPLGARGERPLYIDGLLNEYGKRIAALVPGADVRKGRLAIAWEALEALQTVYPPAIDLLASQVAQFNPKVELPGLDEYKQLFAPRLRDYQKVMVQFLALRAYAINGDPMRSGKSPTTLAASSVVGAKKVLIACPSIAKLVWATEIVKWFNLPSVLLYGRSADEAREFCHHCVGSGRDSEGKHCKFCKTKNGQAFGTIVNSDPSDVSEAIKHHRFIIANFDVLTPQYHYDEAGKRTVREDLPGWFKLLNDTKFDLCIIDEGHVLRGRSKRERAGESRRDRLLAICRDIERVWLLSGTPVFGRVADLWSILDLITDGLFGRPFFGFDVRYCLPAGARVWMGDQSHRNIEDLCVGDMVWGWEQKDRRHRKLVQAKVLRTFVREAEVVEATLASGRKVRSTRDHLWASPVSKAVPYRTLSLGRASERTGREDAKRRASTLAMVLDAEPLVGEITSHDYNKGYAHGLCDGDGTISFRWYLRSKRNKTCADLVRRVQVRQDSMNTEALARFEQALTTCNVRYVKSSDKVFPGITADGAQALDFFYAPREGADSYWRGWLAGMYDAEGWGCTFAQHVAVNPETHSNLRDALARFGFEVAFDRETVRIVGNGKGARGSAMREFIRFWALTQPAIQRKMEPVLHAALYWQPDPVVAIKPLGTQKVYDIKTSTENFVVDGYGSHNCNGHKGEYGWENDGITNPEELASRLKSFMLKRARAEILPGMPPKTRQVVRIDPAKKAFKAPKVKGSGGLHAALRVTAGIKRDTVTEAVVNECGEGSKVVVFAYHREGAQELAKAIAEASGDDPRCKLRNMRVWCVTGDTPVEARFRQAQAYREWVGAAAFVATIDSVPVAISLKGATSVHFADLTFDPASLLQAEDRSYEVGSTGLAIIYYLVSQTVDEHVLGLVLPKMEQMETMTKEAAANDFRVAFGAIPDMDALAEDIWKRMEAAVL